MIPIDENEFEKCIGRMISLVQNPRVKKKLKKVLKGDVFNYHFTLPIIIAQAVSNYINLENKSEIKILVHELNDHDCFDHLRWVSFVPHLINKPDLSIKVVAISETTIKDTLTKSRPLIDSFIENELEPTQFESTLYEADISSAIDSYDGFDLIINNIATPQEIFKLAETEIISKIINNGAIYVLSDFTELTLLNNLNCFRANGFGEDSEICRSNLGIQFSAYPGAQTYRHGSYFISIEKELSNSLDISLSEFASFIQSLTLLLNSGNRLCFSDILHNQSDNEIVLFSTVFIELNSRTATFNYNGDHYKFMISQDIDLKELMIGESDRCTYLYKCISIFSNLHTNLLKEISNDQ